MGKLIYGRNSVLDALKNDLPITKVYLSKTPTFSINSDIQVLITDRKQMDKIIRENHQGFIAELKEFNYFTLEDLFNDKPENVLVLDHIQDPHNFGAIIRSANAAGVKHIIIPKERAVSVTPAVLKVSSGGFVGMKIVRVGSLVDAMQKLKKQDFWVYASSLDKATNVEDITFNKPTVLIVGNESKGVSRSLLKVSDQNIFIKMSGDVQSLNVSVAAGILLFKL